MLVCLGYYIDPNSGEISNMPGAVMYDYAEGKLRKKMEKKPGIKKVTVSTLPTQFEETVKREGLVTR
jgi:hypothetical protein